MPGDATIPVMHVRFVSEGFIYTLPLETLAMEHELPDHYWINGYLVGKQEYDEVSSFLRLLGTKESQKRRLPGS